MSVEGINSAQPKPKFRLNIRKDIYSLIFRLRCTLYNPTFFDLRGVGDKNYFKRSQGKGGTGTGSINDNMNII